jgi:hypothetical protein
MTNDPDEVEQNMTQAAWGIFALIIILFVMIMWSIIDKLMLDNYFFGGR